MNHAQPRAERPFAMSATFALISAVLIGLAAALLSTTLSSYLEQSLLAQSRSDALAVARALVTRVHDEVFAGRPFGDVSLDIQEPSQLSKIQYLVDGMSPSLGLERLAIVDKAGEVIFCTDRRRIGDDIARVPAIAAALTGAPGFDVVAAADCPLFGPGPTGEVLQTVIPVGQPNQPPLGAVALYRSARLLRELQAAGVRMVVGTCLAVLVGLFALLAIFVWQADIRLAASAATVRRQNDELKRNQVHLVRSNRLAAIGELAGGIAHELNNPLAGIRIFVEGLSRRQRSDTVADADFRRECGSILTTLLTEVDRCRTIIQNLLTFARQESGDAAPCADANAVVTEVATLVDLRRRQQSVEVVTALSPDLPAVAIGTSELGQVLMNVVTNALQAMPEGGTLTLTTATGAGGTVEVVVRDTGPGIPEELRDRVFEPFFTTKPPGEGTGLGLAISYGIVSKRGGELGLRPADEGGTSCRLVLPAATNDDDETAAERKEPSPRA